MPTHRFLNHLRTRLLGPPAPRLGTRLQTGVKLLVVVEGQHDVTFLRGISRILHADDPMLPDLGKLERVGVLVILPVGGGDLVAWAARMAALGLPEFHLLDREVPPATERRQQAAEIVNQRPSCRACVTNKRAIENYLHPLAVQEVSSLDMTFGDEEDVADLVARLCFERQDHELPWEDLPGRAKKRCRETAKRWLNRQAVERMTPRLVDERDPDGEVRGWLEAIGEMVVG
ncbi:MAG TPA: ATP-dependent endonuclease [Pirellulales bacterium]|nr:ATP-dependent endonuclease [Pirellulales bacterium]